MEDKDLELKQCGCEGECTCEQEDTISEELLDLLYNQPLKLNTDNVSEVELCEECFAEGVHMMSEVCGRISALLSVGLTTAQALDYIINEQTIDHNYRITEMNNQTQVEISKNQSLQAEKSMI